MASHELLAAYAAKTAISRGGDTIRFLVKLYREVPEGLQALAPTTRAQWVRWLDRIEADLGDFPLKLLKAKGARRTLTEWRDRFASTPRQADYAIQVLRRVLAVGVEREVIADNPAVGIKQLYRANRADVVLSSDELEAVLAKATPHARYAIRLAAATGLRRGDLVALRWDQVLGNRIELNTGKSRGRTFVIAPLVEDGAAVIEELRLERERQIAEGRPSIASVADFLDANTAQFQLGLQAVGPSQVAGADRDEGRARSGQKSLDLIGPALVPAGQHDGVHLGRFRLHLLTDQDIKSRHVAG